MDFTDITPEYDYIYIFIGCVCVLVKGQLSGAGCFLSTVGFGGWTQGIGLVWKALSLPEPSYSIIVFVFFRKVLHIHTNTYTLSM